MEEQHTKIDCDSSVRAASAKVVCDDHGVAFKFLAKRNEHAYVYMFRVSEVNEPKQNASRCKLT